MKTLNITEIKEENELLKKIIKNLEDENEKLLDYISVLESKKNGWNLTIYNAFIGMTPKK